MLVGKSHQNNLGWLWEGNFAASKFTDLPTLGKEKSGDPWKKISLETLQKIARFYFSPIKPLFQEGTRHQPHSQDVLPFQNGRQTRRKTISCLRQAKLTARYKKVVSTVFFFTSLSLYGTTIIPIVFNNLIHFISERFFPKNREIGSLVVRPWEMTKRNRETHGRTVRVGRSEFISSFSP